MSDRVFQSLEEAASGLTHTILYTSWARRAGSTQHNLNKNRTNTKTIELKAPVLQPPPLGKFHPGIFLRGWVHTPQTANNNHTTQEKRGSATTSHHHSRALMRPPQFPLRSEHLCKSHFFPTKGFHVICGPFDNNTQLLFFLILSRI